MFKSEQKTADKSLSVKDILENWGKVNDEGKEMYRTKYGASKAKSGDTSAASSSSSSAAVVEGADGDGAAAPVDDGKEGGTAMDVAATDAATEGETAAPEEPAVVSQPEESAEAVPSTPAESEPVASGTAEETTAAPSSPRPSKGKGKEAATPKTSPPGKKGGGRKPKADAKSPAGAGAVSPVVEKETEGEGAAVMAE
eukprot:gene33116-40865_t